MFPNASCTKMAAQNENKVYHKLGINFIKGGKLLLPTQTVKNERVKTGNIIIWANTQAVPKRKKFIARNYFALILFSAKYFQFTVQKLCLRFYCENLVEQNEPTVYYTMEVQLKKLVFSIIIM